MNEQMESVKDDTDIYDWSKLDENVAQMANTFCYVPSMFGTFDFDAVAQSSDASQKQRKTRRKAEIAVEKRPISVTHTGKADAGAAKVEAIFKTIKEVCIIAAILAIIVCDFLSYIFACLFVGVQ